MRQTTQLIQKHVHVSKSPWSNYHDLALKVTIPVDKESNFLWCLTNFVIRSYGKIYLRGRHLWSVSLTVSVFAQNRLLLLFLNVEENFTSLPLWYKSLSMTIASRRIDEIGNLFPGTKRKLHYVNSPEERTNSCLSYLRLGSFKEKPTLSRFQCCHRQLRSYTERMWNSKPSETCSERGANLSPDALKSERFTLHILTSQACIH